MAEQAERNTYREWLQSLDQVPYASQILRCGSCLNPHLVSIDVLQNAQMFQARDGVDWTCAACTIGVVGPYTGTCHGANDYGTDRCANDNWRLWADAGWGLGVAYRGAASGELVPSISGDDVIEILEVE